MLYVKKLDEAAVIPTVANEGDLGHDVYALEEVNLWPGQVYKVRTGIAVSAFTVINIGDYKCPESAQEPLGLIIKDRSSMAAKGVFTHGGVIDAAYTGEIVVLMSTLNHYHINKGEKIAQMVPVSVLTSPVLEIESLETSSRGDKGFGSSGV